MTKFVLQLNIWSRRVSKKSDKAFFSVVIAKAHLILSVSFGFSWDLEVLMNIRKKFFDFDYPEVLDIKTRELIRVACAIAVQCPD